MNRRTAGGAVPTDVQSGRAVTGSVDNNGRLDLIISAGDQAADLYHHRFTRREGSSLLVYAGNVEQLDLMGIPAKDRPRLHWLVDPVDYSKHRLRRRQSGLGGSCEKRHPVRILQGRGHRRTDVDHHALDQCVPTSPSRHARSVRRGSDLPAIQQHGIELFGSG